jgi:citrate lyase beta subunit
MDNCVLEKEITSYKVGSLLYVPALNYKAISKVINKGIPGVMSIAFCLEDSIDDSSVDVAESKVIETFLTLSQDEANEANEANDTPLYFIRTRSPQQMLTIAALLEDSIKALCGFILPKFGTENAEEYFRVLSHINANSPREIFVMPILETKEIAYIESRAQTIEYLRGVMDSDARHILNVRVGGNDLCSIFSVRPELGQTIYDISVIRDILSDIVNYFGRDYVVSAPVSDFFCNHEEGDSSGWRKAFEQELRLDVLNGFIGKTVIHPAQIPIVNNAFKVSLSDFYDAQQIIDWRNQELGVAKSSTGNRMNERNVHTNWAQKILCRASAYGVRE